MKTKKSYSLHPLVLLLLSVSSVWAQRGPQDSWYLDREIDLPQMPGMNKPRNLSISQEGKIYLGEIGSDRIQILDINGSMLDTFGYGGDQVGEFNDPWGSAIDSNGELFVVDKNNNRIQVFDQNGNFVRSFGSYGSGNNQFDQPTAVDVSDNGKLYIADHGNKRVQVFTKEGAFISNFPIIDSKTPNDLKIGPEGKIHVITGGEYKVHLYETNGTLIRKSGHAWGGQGVCVAPDGSVFAIEGTYHRIKKFNSSFEFIKNIGGDGSSSDNGKFNSPRGMAIYENQLFVCDENNHRIQVFDLNGTFLRKFGFYSTGSVDITALSCTPEGSILACDAGSDNIIEFDLNGSIIRFLAHGGNNLGEVNDPYGIALGPNGRLYVSEKSNDRIQVFDRNGTVNRIFGSNGSDYGEFNEPWGIAISDSGEVFVADSLNHRIQVFDLNGTFLRSWGSQGSLDVQFNLPRGLDIDDNGNIIVADFNNNRVVVFDTTGSFIRKWTITSKAWQISNLNNGLVLVGGGGNTDPRLNLYDRNGLSVKEWNHGGNGYPSPVVSLPDGTLVMAHRGIDRFLLYRPTYRSIRPNPSKEIPLPEVISVAQRSGTNYLDVTYRVNDADSATVQSALLGFVDGGNDLSKVIVPKTFVGNTVGKLGHNVPTGQSHTVTWNAGADWNVGFGELEMAVLAKDDRDLLNLHFLTLPATESNSSELKINRSPITDNDLLNVWYWLLATDSSYQKVGSGIFATSDLNTTGIQPNQLSGLMLWLDAKDIDADGAEDSPSVDDLMTEWKDKSSSALTFVSASGKEPKYIAGNSKSRAGWYFNNGYVKSTDAWSGLKELAAVMNLMDNRFWAAGIVGPKYQRYLAMNGNDRLYNGGADRIMGIAGYSEQIPVSVNHVVFKTFQSPKSSNQMHIGSNGDNYENWNGTISEVIGFDRILTDEERNGLHAYFHSKWGTNLANPIASGSYFSDQSTNIILNRMNLREATVDEVTRAKEGATTGMINQFTPSFQVGPNERPDKVNEYGFDTGSTSGIWVVPKE